MYPNNYFMGKDLYRSKLYEGNPYYWYPYSSAHSYPYKRGETIQGQATWTEGGQVTKCGIPWSENEYMTVAVGEDAPYKCGQTIKLTNFSQAVPREVLVTVVDEVQGYPANKVNLHRKAFEALGADPSVGVIHVQIEPVPKLEDEKWGKFLLEIVQTSYPDGKVLEYNHMGSTKTGSEQIQETYDFILQSPKDKITIRGEVIYNPNKERVISVNIKEI